MENSLQKSQNERTEKAMDAGTKVLAVFGLIVLLALISIGIIKIAPPIIRGIAQGAASATALPVTMPSFPVTVDQTIVESGQSFVVSWESPDNEPGSFTVSYPCISQFYLEAVGQPAPTQTVTQSGSQNSIIYCNSDFQFLNTNNSITLEGFVQSVAAQNSAANADANADVNSTVYQPVTQPISVPITVHFVENSAIQAGVQKDTAVGTVNVTVLPQQYSAPAPTPALPATATPATAASTALAVTAGEKTESVYPIQIQSSLDYTPNTNADLSVQILATGAIDPNTNAFVPENAVNPTQRGAIQFEVSNIGGRATGSWSFSAILPTYPQYDFMSEAQPSLNPGDKVIYTISFTQIQDQPQDTFTINADNTDEVTETDKTNNIVHGILYIDDQTSGN